MSAIDSWERGSLKVFMPAPAPRLAIAEHEYERFWEGWAILVERPFLVPVDELPGVLLEFDLRHDRLQCIGVRSSLDGPEITRSLLQRLVPLIKQVAEETFTVAAVRLIELPDGTVAGEFPIAPLRDGAGNAVGYEFGVLDDDAKTEARSRGASRPGRPRLPERDLRRIAALYVEAEKLGRAPVEWIAKCEPGIHSDAKVRRWIRRARSEGFLPSIEPKGETDG